ncbi:arsenate reductase ArsC [Nocardia huaxiensis]|uniref:arsenate reductase ArsC n=1 Tax=Nocardia huaxiensis TaxID=2755382 RepID=UPI001E3538F1|nr:arsenate reductase ArsC [Nocardia huaxiensis]UFT00377.1 arsenate reductase ArsC [Nocardia huaxiensis]
MRLAAEFAGLCDLMTVERILVSSYELLTGTVAAPDRLPVLAERFARERLTAHAKALCRSAVHGPAVLFVCTHNAGRSQMARGIFAHLVGDHAPAWSGGSQPGAVINPLVVEVMAERGIDISAEFPKPWTEEFIVAADVVIDMGCGDTDPIMSGHRFEQWALADPAEQSIDDVRHIRDEIEHRVRRLVTDLHLPRGGGRPA